MAVRFILGRAGTGKTHACVSEVLDALAGPDDDARLILLVPEQASFQMERLLALRSPRRGFTRAAVLSFSRLAQRVWDELGSEPPLVSASARSMALRAVVAHEPESLRYYRQASRTHGFYGELEHLIEELLRENIMPEELRAAARQIDDGRTQRKIAEVAGLFAAYLDWLGPHRLDPALRLRVLRERLEQWPGLRQARVWVDGFAGFTGQETETLVTLGRHVREMHISLLVDPDADLEHEAAPLHLFRRTVTTYQELRSLLNGAGVEVRPPLELTPPAPPRFTSGGLARLEAGLAGANAPDGQGSGAAVRVVECESHREELRAAARFIRQEVAAGGGALRYRDFAIIARSLEPIAQTVASVFEEYEIPYFLDRRRPLRGHPLSRLVRALLDAVDGDCSTAVMTRLLRSELLPLARDAAEHLENTIVAHQVWGLAAWRQPAWDFGAEEAVFAGRAAPQGGAAEAPELRDGRLRIAAGIDVLKAAAQAAEAPSGAAWAAALHEALRVLEVPGRLGAWIQAARAAGDWEAAELHRLAWETLCDVLDDVHTVLAETPVTLDELAEVLGSVLGDLTRGLAPPTLDQVLVGSIERSRHPDIKHAWIVAFNEGIFPARPADDRVFSTAEREALAAAGLAALRPRRDDAYDEALLAYIACSRPSHGLTISYALMDDEGEALQPSALLNEIEEHAPGLERTAPAADAPPSTLPAVVRGVAKLRGVVEVDGVAEARRRYAALRKRLAADARHGPVLAWLLRGESYENTPPSLTAFRCQRAEEGLVWSTSPSELEKYLQCPFQHFAAYGLRLDDQRGPRPLSWDLGTLAHNLLAETTRRVMELGTSVQAVTDEQWLAALEGARAGIEERWPRDLADRMASRVFLARLLAERLQDLVLAHAERWRRGTCGPWRVEQAFGRRAGRDWPALRIAADGGMVLVRGMIDRVDRSEGGGGDVAIIYDYKSTATSVRPPFLTGARLQLFLYAQAVLAAPRAGVKRVEGVFLAPLWASLGVLGNKYAQEVEPDVQRMYMYRPSGVFTPAGLMVLDSGDESKSPVVNLQRTKDGRPYKTSRELVEAEDIAARLDLATETVRCAAEGVFGGAIGIEPLVESKTLACRNCAYINVCRYDRYYNAARLAESEDVLPQLPEDEPAGEEDEG